MAAGGLGGRRTGVLGEERPPGFLALFSQSLGALIVDGAGLIAGLIFACSLPYLPRRLWPIAAYPCVLTIRGMVGGVFCGRLSSSLWLGTVKPCFLGNTREFGTLYRAMMVLSALSALMMICSLSLYGLAWGITARDVADMAVAVITTMAFAFAVATPISALVAFLSFRRGLDPDVVTYPVGSTSSDIVVTGCYVATLILMELGWAGRAFSYVVCSSFLAACLLLALRERRSEGFRRTLRESLVSSAVVVLISGLTGTLLGQMSVSVGLGPEIAMAYPAIIGTVGDVGSIVGSTATTKLWSGELEASLGSLRRHAREVLAAWLASACMFSAYALLASLACGLRALPGLLAIFLLANLMAVGATVLLALGAGVLTFRRGLDPDNFVIPIESSAADAITTLSLLLATAAMMALGVR